MDLKVRRAALSAAIKVTVSATLLGCGGIASSSNPPEGMAGGANADRAGTGGTTSAETGGTANEEMAGAPAAGGAAPASECGSPRTNDCLAYFDALQLKSGEALPNGMAAACCQVVMDEMAASASSAEGRQCSRALQERLGASGVLYECCWKTGSTLAACTPWGPPVPAELLLEQLLAWEAA
jgi:hypothetical protein